MRILILHDEIPPGSPPDQVDAAIQAEVVQKILLRQGHVVKIDAFRSDPEPILSFAPDVVFNLVEMVGGDGRLAHLPPALFEALGLKFTGTPAASMAVSTHKRLSKRFLAAKGFSVPEDWPRGGPRWIVKSLWEHGSVGLDDSCIVGADQVEATMARMAPRMGGEVVAETYIDGREINVSLLEEDGEIVVLPLAEMTFSLPEDRERIVGYAAKWHKGSVEEVGIQRTFEVEGIDHSRVADLCRRVFRSLSLRGYVRVDLRIPFEGTEPYVLEVNANPCLAPGASFPAAVEQSGRTLDDAVRAIVKSALR